MGRCSHYVKRIVDRRWSQSGKRTMLRSLSVTCELGEKVEHSIKKEALHGPPRYYDLSFIIWID